jgi:D-3-phosphoglycerate dehydrogenase
MSVAKVVYLGPLEGFKEAVAASDGVAVIEHVAAEQELVARALKVADALLDASMRVRITSAMLTHAPRLRMISCATTGSDHIACDEAERRGIEIRTLREDGALLQGLTPAAELSWALLMACARRIVPAVAHVREGGWVREEFPGVMLRGRTLGLIGCGRIGQWMARYASAFDMKIVGYDPYVDPWPPGIDPVPISDLVERADVVSVHVPMNEQTRGLLSAELFARMRLGVIVINTSRGAVADETALLRELESGRISAVGLDVLDGEPDIESHPLLAYARGHDNLLITPHCGGYSPDAVRLVCRRAAEKIVERLQESP